MGKIATVAFAGASGAEYSFEVYTLDTSFNNVGAVYMFTVRTVSEGKGAHEPIYIGETGELADRYVNHEKWPCVEMHGANCICMHRDDNQASRLDKETDLLRANDPPCNEQ